MSTTATPPKVGPEAVLARLDAVEKKYEDKLAEVEARHARELDEVKKSVAQPQRGNEIMAPYGVIGRLPGDSEGYSVLRAAAFAKGVLPREKCKYEVDAALKLKAVYENAGWRPTLSNHSASFVIPFCTRHIPRDTSEGERLVGELKEKMVANAHLVDPAEAEWLARKMGVRAKDFGTVQDTGGGTLVGFPTLGELVDIQRNIEVFAQAGATEQALPPNGRLQIPKLTGTTTAYWVGEGAAITESTPATGYLDLTAKKLGILVDLNNELIRFASVTAEAMVRADMAKVGALKLDLAMLEGTGGTQILGLINYPSASSWTPGQDKLLAYTVTSNLLQVKDAAEMEALLPDTAGEPTAWVMRRQLWAKLRNRRADAVTVTDAAGPFLASITRSLQEKQGYEWDGTKVVRSSQVSNTRGNGSQTYALLGYFPDWITARFGIMEFLSTNVSDQALANDQTRLRAIQHVDAGPRHASSFVLADSITVA